jgi:hypothetical protein
LRAAKNGLASVCRPADHHGESLSSPAINAPPCETVKS